MDEASSDDKTANDKNDFADDADENDDDGSDEYRTIADALDGNLDESMFLELQDDVVTDTDEKATYYECLNTATRHTFFGSTQTQFGAKEVSEGLPRASATRKTIFRVS